MINPTMSLKIQDENIYSTEQHQIQSEELYKSLFHENNSVMMVLNPATGEIKDANRAACRFYGWSHSELRNRNISEINMLSNEQLKDKLQSAVKEKRRQFFSRHRLANGEIRDVEVLSGPIKLDNVTLLYSLVHDITDRKKAEEALRLSELKFYHAFHSSPSMDAIITAEEGVFIEINESFLRFLGYTHDEVIGHSISELNIWADPEQATLLRTKLHEKGCVRNFESTFLSKTGEIGFGLICATIINIAGKSCLLTKTVDITERKRTDEALQNMQKLESLGILAGGIAHDFNNLMGGIFGYVDLAIEQSTDSTVTGYLTKAVNAIGRARALTRQLLTFAKGGAPRQKIDNFFPFIKETAAFALSGSNVTCHYHIQENLWAGNYDRNQIGQVIDNIIINAQQAMPLGGTIDLTARNVALSDGEHPILAKGNYVRVSVKDYGIGIPEKLLSRIFDPFFTTKAKGHGLGLATCFSIIKRHGGHINVESEPGRGSIFYLYLPAVSGAAQTESAEIKNLHKGSGTFLIMDDEVVMQETIQGMLESLGYKVVCKEDGQGALEFLSTESKQNRPVSGAIFDLTVPGGMGGKVAVEQIRKSKIEIPVFVASGYAENPIMKNPTDYGFTASICKPFRKNELSEMLNKYMEPRA